MGWGAKELKSCIKLYKKSAENILIKWGREEEKIEEEIQKKKYKRKNTKET